MISRDSKVGAVQFGALRVKASGDSPMVAAGATLAGCMAALDNYITANDPTQSDHYMLIQIEVTHIIAPRAHLREKIEAIRRSEQARSKEAQKQRKRAGVPVKAGKTGW